jgi:hypothetical protein
MSSRLSAESCHCELRFARPRRDWRPRLLPDALTLMSVETSRKPGGFDPRWPCGCRNGSDGVPRAPPLLAADIGDGLDWSMSTLTRSVEGET